MKEIKPFIKLVLVIAVVAFITLYVGDKYSYEPQEQGLLAFLLLFAYIVYDKFRSYDDFEPFYLQVHPNWEKLINDKKLGGPNALEKVNELIWLNKSKEYNVVTNGIRISFLKPNLIFSHYLNNFATRVDITEDIELLRIGESTSLDHLNTPKVYIKQDIEGYELGLITPKSLNKSIMAGDGRERIKLALLPYEALSLYYGGKVTKMKEKSLNKKLKENEWGNGTIDDDFYWRMPSSLEHKYFTVYYDNL